jgi:hypothetical protein
VTLIRSLPMSLVACGFMLIACAIHGCGCNSPSGGLPIPNKAFLQPDRLVLKQVDLTLAGSKFRADIKQSNDGDQVTIDLLSEGQLIESEIYKSTGENFSVINAGGEQYEPPLPLIRYGMHVGEAWKWSGQLMTGPAARKAAASIKTSTEGMSIDGGIVPNTIKVEVELSIDSGRVGEPSKRKLTFWIAPEMGVVKRAFGDYSLRTPVED